MYDRRDQVCLSIFIIKILCNYVQTILSVLNETVTGKGVCEQLYYVYECDNIIWETEELDIWNIFRILNVKTDCKLNN